MRIEWWSRSLDRWAGRYTLWYKRRTAKAEETSDG